MSEFDIISDQSKQKLTKIPESVLNMFNVKMLYLEGNSIEYIPEDLFLKLTKLNWFDLRNNRLRCIPRSIAYHENLENLLLSNNCLEKLPNELGLVPKLKVLQVSQNPLIYPCRTIVTSGVQAICAYLRSQYVIENSEERDADTMSGNDADCLNTRMPSEASTYTDASSEGYTINLDENVSRTVFSTVKPKKSKRKHGYPEPTPVITITSLSKPIDVCNKETNIEVTTHIKPGDDQLDNPVIHEFSRDNSQISLKSYYKKKEPVGLEDNSEMVIFNAQLKQHWMEKIKTILAEQERILQQEKNLMALKDWREEKKMESPRYVDFENLPKPPYDTQKEYMTMASRADLINGEVEKYEQECTNRPSKVNVEGLISELAQQLKDLGSKCTDEKSTRNEIEEAAKQIKMVMKIYNKIQSLQEVNDKSV